MHKTCGGGFTLRNITLSADDRLIEKARAREQRLSLNAVFRRWLESYAAEQDGPERYRALMERLDHVKAGGTFTREERSER